VKKPFFCPMTQFVLPIEHIVAGHNALGLGLIGIPLLRKGRLTSSNIKRLEGAAAFCCWGASIATLGSNDLGSISQSHAWISHPSGSPVSRENA